MKYDSLYDAFQYANEQRKRNNFNTFIEILDARLTKDLDNYYVTDRKQYEIVLANIKEQGIRVFRNSEGKHKLKFM